MAKTVAMNAPKGGSVVECQPDQVGYFESIGWTQASKKKTSETAKATRKPKAIKSEESK